MQIKNIIFDFGGVLLDLEPSATYRDMSELGIFDGDAHEFYLANKSLFDGYEKGKVITENFLWNIQAKCKRVPPVDKVIKAWNAMLLGWNPGKLKFLEAVSQQYNTYLLSNTNELHLEWVRRDLKNQHGITDFDQRFFKKSYYSHRIGMRKPDQEIFAFVLEDASLNAGETLFIDDNADNVAAAASLGIHAKLHISNADIDLEGLLSEIRQT
ncbi:MAG: HAD-IA family hydrolase [Saprospiraceae bacterium]|nr:HAD-IA family hydrolase [Saprospiraceae bacterium]